MEWSWKGKKHSRCWQNVLLLLPDSFWARMDCLHWQHRWNPARRDYAAERGGETHQALHKSTPDTNLLLNYNMGFCSLLPHWWRPFIPRVTHSMLSTWNTWLLVTLEMFAVLLSTFQKKKNKKNLCCQLEFMHLQQPEHQLDSTTGCTPLTHNILGSIFLFC